MAVGPSSPGGGGSPGHTIGTIFVASCVASCTQKLALFPLDTIKVRIMRPREAERAMLTVTWPSPQTRVQIQRQGDAHHTTGARGTRSPVRVVSELYRGIAPALLGVIPVSLVYMPVYELFKVLANELPTGRQALGRLCAGSMAGLACSIVPLLGRGAPGEPWKPEA